MAATLTPLGGSGPDPYAGFKDEYVGAAPLLFGTGYGTNTPESAMATNLAAPQSQPAPKIRYSRRWQYRDS